MAEWKKVGGDQIPKVPADLEFLSESINDVVGFLTNLLDIALTSLEIVKAFAVGNIDPILAIIDATIDEIEAILKDMLNAGFYFTGDWFLLTPPFENLRGGYSSFEGRMVGRFTDVSDQTRPQFGEKVPVFAVFFYTSASFPNVHILLGFLKSLAEFFNFDFRLRPTQGTPISLSVSYRHGEKRTVVKNILDSFVKFPGNSIDTATVMWNMPQTPKNPRHTEA